MTEHLLLDPSVGVQPTVAFTRYRRVHLIADPIYGYVEITKPAPNESSEQDIIDTVWVQRLRRVHQLQAAWWIYPSAEHSRFVHLLGAMHLASQFAKGVYPSLAETFPHCPSRGCVEETLRLAGLLHDVGHGPFGHFFDQEVLSQWHLDHEDVGRFLIENYLADRIASIKRSPTDEFEPGESVDPRWVMWIMADRELDGFIPPDWLKALKPILCGPATVDNMDYVPRDAHMCGVRLGPVDVQRIIHYSFICGDTLALHSHAAGALEMFLASRLYMYTQVYHHRTGRRFDLSMKEIFRDTIAEMLEGTPMESPDAYSHLTDWSLLEHVQDWSRGSDPTRKALGGQWMNILNRNLPWHLAYENILHRDIRTAKLEERIRSELPAKFASVRIVVDVSSAKVAPNNPMADDGMVVLYDPDHGIDRKRTAELVKRLPQYNQLVRIFTDNEAAVESVNRIAEQAIPG